MQREWHGSIRLIRPSADLGHAIGENESAVCYATLTEARAKPYHLIIDLVNTPSINSIGLDELSATARVLRSTHHLLILINIGHLSEALQHILVQRFVVRPDVLSALAETTTFTSS